MEPIDPHPAGEPVAQDPAPERLRARLQRQLRDRKTRPVTLGLLAAAAGLVLVLVYWVTLLRELPTTEDLRRSRFERATVVYAADGSELTSYQDKNRKWVTLEEISPHVVHALLAAEDHRFYDHHGIDLLRTAGAFFRTVGGDAQGGSTITMQLARNAFTDLQDDMVVTRKIKEWITALRLEGMYEKDEILEMYLNTVPFMYNAFGIEAAAQTYFQASAKELNPKGAATLVGLLKGTVYYNPVRHPERSHERRNVVLQKMVEHGYLKAEEYEQMKDVPSRLDFRRLTREDELAPHFTTYLRQWLDEWAEANGYNLYTDGLRVHTTIDPRLQQAAEEAVRRVGAELQAVADVEWSRSRPGFFSPDAGAYRGQTSTPFSYFWATNGKLLDSYIKQTTRYADLRSDGVTEAQAIARLRDNAAFIDSLTTERQRLQAGFVAISPRDGSVLAWVGGRDFGAIQFDHVAQSRRQPGSTFKPFVYAAALENGYSPETLLRDEAVEFVDPDTRRRWRPKNVGSISGQMVSLRDALAYSKNTVTARLVLELGPQRVIETAQRMGIRSELPPYPSVGLGTGEVSLLELTGAYTTIADHGRHHEPVFVSRIEDQEGRVLATFASRSQDALSSVTAYELLDMLRGVVQYGTGQRIRYGFGASGDLAGKTGTTQNGADGWFVLMHPNLVMGAWVGFDVPKIAFRSDYWGQGSHNALHVVGQFYRAARRGAGSLLADATFQPPPGYYPPAPADTTRFATYYDSAYLDSLNAVTDSLLNAGGGYDSAYDDSTWQPGYGYAEYEDRMLSGDSLDGEAGYDGSEEEPEPATEADSLNRLQRLDRPASRPRGGRAPLPSERRRDDSSGTPRGGLSAPPGAASGDGSGPPAPVTDPPAEPPTRPPDQQTPAPAPTEPEPEPIPPDTSGTTGGQ